MILARLSCAGATRKGRASCRHNLHGAAAQGRGRCFAAWKRGTGAGRFRECVRIGHKNDRNFRRESTSAPLCVARSACAHLTTHTSRPRRGAPAPGVGKFQGPMRKTPGILVREKISPMENLLRRSSSGLCRPRRSRTGSHLLRVLPPAWAPSAPSGAAPITPA